MELKWKKIWSGSNTCLWEVLLLKIKMLIGYNLPHKDDHIGGKYAITSFWEKNREYKYSSLYKSYYFVSGLRSVHLSRFSLLLLHVWEKRPYLACDFRRCSWQSRETNTLIHEPVNSISHASQGSVLCLCCVHLGWINSVLIKESPSL